MSDQTVQDQPDQPGTRAITPRGQRLPQVTPTEVLPMVEALASFNGPVSKKRVAGAMNMTDSGGAFKGRWAAIGYYGFREDTPDGRHTLSARGQAVLSEDSAVALEAQQHALVASGYRAILNRFSTSPVNQTAIEGVLEEDLLVPQAQGKKLAAVLISSAEEAELIADNRFQVAPIEQALEAVGEITVTAVTKPASTGTKQNGAAKPKPAAPARPSTSKIQPAPAVQRVEVGGQAGPFAVSVEVKIDAQQHSPQEIGQIVREVREALLPETAPPA